MSVTCDLRAEETNTLPVVTKQVTPRIRSNWIDIWQDHMSADLIEFVDHVDHFFGEHHVNDDVDQTRVQLGVGIVESRYDGLKIGSRIRGRVALPILKRQLHLIFFDDTLAENGQIARPVANAVQEPAPFVAVQKIVADEREFRVNTDAGLRLGHTKQVFGRVRLRGTFTFDKLELRLTEIPGWYSHDGFNEITEMRWTQQLGNDWLVSSTSDCTWDELHNGVLPEQTFSLINDVNERRAFRVDLYGGWQAFPEAYETAYKLTFTYRQLIYSDWLYMELSPGIQFEQQHNYSEDPFIGIAFDSIFGEK
jgi:hypothetical protein